MKTWHSLIVVVFLLLFLFLFCLFSFSICLNRFASLHSLSLKASRSHQGHDELFFKSQVLSQATERETFSFHYSAWAALYCPRVVPNGHNTLRQCYEGMHGASQQDSIQRTGQTWENEKLYRACRITSSEEKLEHMYHFSFLDTFMLQNSSIDVFPERGNHARLLTGRMLCISGLQCF